MANPYPRAYFQVLDEAGEAPESGRYLGTAATAGPWDPGHQHGGPPNALLVRAAERLAAATAAGSALHACRIAAEFVGPVPVGELATTARVVRAARSGTLVEVALHAAGRECLHARVWLVAERDTAEVAAPPSPIAAPPSGPPAFSLSFPYADSIDWHEVSGSATTPGPAAVWARPRLPLVDGEALTGLQRAALIGDSASGVSAALDWEAWTFLNVDLDVHLSRPLHGEWIHLDAVTHLGDRGAALARSTVSDVRGVAGCTAQTLIVAPRRR